MKKVLILVTVLISLLLTACGSSYKVLDREDEEYASVVYILNESKLSEKELKKICLDELKVDDSKVSDEDSLLSYTYGCLIYLDEDSYKNEDMPNQMYFYKDGEMVTLEEILVDFDDEDFDIDDEGFDLNEYSLNEEMLFDLDEGQFKLTVTSATVKDDKLTLEYKIENIDYEDKLTINGYSFDVWSEEFDNFYLDDSNGDFEVTVSVGETKTSTAVYDLEGYEGTYFSIEFYPDDDYFNSKTIVID